MLSVNAVSNQLYLTNAVETSIGIRRIVLIASITTTHVRARSVLACWVCTVAVRKLFTFFIVYNTEAV